jgi:hypothetical protein
MSQGAERFTSSFAKPNSNILHNLFFTKLSQAKIFSQFFTGCSMWGVSEVKGKSGFTALRV